MVVVSLTKWSSLPIKSKGASLTPQVSLEADLSASGCCSTRLRRALQDSALFRGLAFAWRCSLTQSSQTRPLQPHGLQRQAALSSTVSRSLLKLTCTESVMLSNRLILCCTLLLSPSVFLSIRVFSSESFLLIRWPKDWSFSFSISPSSEYSGLISFRTDWLDLLAVQGTLKSLLQHHSSKASILWRSAFFMVQLSHPYMTTGKTIGLTGWTFVGKVMSLLFNMLTKLVITFLPKSKCLLISWYLVNWDFG